MAWEPKKISLTEGLKARIFIFGPNGSGKTHLALTHPWGKTCFIDYDGNPETLRKIKNSPPTDIIQGPRTWTDIQSMWAGKFLDDYEVILLDNVTGMLRYMLEDILRNVSWSTARPHGIPIIGDYGLAAERLRQSIVSLTERAINYRNHVIAIGHERVEKDETTGQVDGYPSVPGQVPALILSKFTEIIYLTYSEAKKKRVAHYTQFKWFKGATRLLESEADIDDPNLTTIYGKIIK